MESLIGSQKLTRFGYRGDGVSISFTDRECTLVNFLLRCSLMQAMANLRAVIAAALHRRNCLNAKTQGREDAMGNRLSEVIPSDREWLRECQIVLKRHFPSDQSSNENIHPQCMFAIGDSADGLWQLRISRADFGGDNAE